MSDAVRHQEKDEESLRNTKARVLLTKENLKKLQIEYDALLKKFQAVQKDRDELYQRFDESLSLACQKGDCKSIILERKLDELVKEVDLYSANVNEIIGNVSMDAGEVQQIISTLEKTLRDKYSSIKRLQVDIAMERKRYQNTKDAFDEKITLIEAHL